MSQYVNFFIRKDDEFISIADYSRNTSICKVMSDAPYEKVREYSYDALQNKIDVLRSEETAYKESIAKYQRHIDLVCKMENNSIEDKYDTISSIEETINELQEEIDSINRQIIELDFIADLIYKDYRIYAGIEISDPTVQDIVDN